MKQPIRARLIKVGRVLVSLRTPAHSNFGIQHVMISGFDFLFFLGAENSA